MQCLKSYIYIFDLRPADAGGDDQLVFFLGGPNDLTPTRTKSTYQGLGNTIVCIYLAGTANQICIFFLTIEVKTLDSTLKTLDTIGNCQRPVFSLGVSQHVHKIKKLVRI